LIKGLLVEHCGDLIIVTKWGTEFTAAYNKPDGRPLLRLLSATDDPKADRGAIFVFRGEAFIAAMRKARELGWIV
jgi:hypothetical protein